MIGSDDISASLISSDEDLLLMIEVTAGSKRDLFPSGYNPWRQAIGVHVKEQAIEGKANKAVISVIAAACNIPKNKISIVSGLSSSSKKIKITGITRAFLLDYLTTHLPED